MKRFITTALCLALLTGCANSEVSSQPDEEMTDSVQTETTAAPTSEDTTPENTTAEDTTAPETTEPDTYEEHDAPLTFPVEEGADPFEVAERYTFEVAAEGVWVLYDGTRAQLLKTDTSDMLKYDDPETFLTHKDYDFDLYTDLFVPELLGRRNIPGRYFRFDPRIGLFVIWDELNETGWCSSTVNDADRTLTFSIGGSAVDWKDTTYEWQDGKLVTVGKKVQYIGGDGMIYIDSYTYENGYEELFYRERAIIENGEWLGTEPVPIEDITDTQGE